MTGVEKIYYALGELAYLVAESDGKVQQEEVVKLHDIVVSQLKKNNPGFEYSDIIFNVLNEEKPNVDLIYDSAIKEINSASYYLTPEIKNQIVSVLTKIGESYDHVTTAQKQIISKVKAELDTINI